MTSYVFLTWITLTKATLLLSAAFVILWFGFYKRKKALVLIFIFITIPLLFSTEAVQKRFRKEISIFEAFGEKDLSISDLRGMGSGRFGRWLDGISIYRNEYDELEQLFGTNLFFKLHNQYIATLLQVGLLGLIVFLLTLWKFYRALLQKHFFYRNPFNFMGIVFLTSLVLYGFGYVSFSFTTMMWITMILVSNVNMKVRRIMPVTKYDNINKLMNNYG
jgi:O-antigen ligase